MMHINITFGNKQIEGDSSDIRCDYSQMASIKVESGPNYIKECNLTINSPKQLSIKSLKRIQIHLSNSSVIVAGMKCAGEVCFQ